MQYEKYFDFIKYSIVSSKEPPSGLNKQDWGEFLAFCERQSIIGLVFHGIEQANPIIPQAILFEWIGSAEEIKATNRLVDKRSQQLCRFWARQGYRYCILKGQANAMMYPQPELRSPGDIDIWLEGSDLKITKAVLKEDPQAKYSFHHIKMPVFDDVSVEVHYRPAYMSNWWYDRKLQRLTKKISNSQFENKTTKGDVEFSTLTDDFNALFQMVHMFGHCFSSRNNLKQIIDYYYLLKRGFSDRQKVWIKQQFRQLGIEHYAAGIMWIEHEMLGLERQYLIVEPDEKLGHLLLNYVISYGVREERVDISLLVHRLTDNLPLVRHFPLTVLIGPIYLIWHQWWKVKMKIKLKMNNNV